MQIQNALITGSFSYNGADLSNITSSNAYSASLSIRTTDLESTSSVLVGASSSFSSILTSVSSSQQQISASLLTLTASYNALSSSYTSLSASYNTASSSFSTRITSDSSSMSSRTTQVEKTYATTGSNTFTGLQNFSNTCTPNSFTAGASIYTAGGLQVTQDSYFSSSVFIKGNVTVFGTQSVSYISSSQLDIGTNIITVNTSTPSVRYGGLSVFDSGSTGLTGSIFWDSELNRWIYVNASGSGGGATYGGGMFISGPRNSVGLGCEQGTTACMLLVGQGGDHLTSSMIYHSSTVTCIPGASITAAGAAIFSSSVTAGGLVSISKGSTTPTDPSLSATNGYLILGDASGYNASALEFGVYRSSPYSSYIQSKHWNNDGATYPLAINPLGANVGIGTCSPGRTLEVSKTAGVDFGLTSVTSGTAEAIFKGYASGTNIDATTSRGTTLNLINLDTTNGNANAIVFHNSNQLATSYIVGVNVNHTSRTGDLIFGTSNAAAPTERLRITSCGNVGIGTCIVRNKLQIGNTLAYANNELAIGNGSIDFAIYMDTAYTNFYTSNGAFTFNSSVAERMRITSCGNVGIGTNSPGNRLQVNHPYNGTGVNLYLYQPCSTWGSQPSYNAYKFISTCSDPSALDGVFKSFNVGPGGVSIGYTQPPTYNCVDALYICGNVGIGTSSPASLLTIAGSSATEVRALILRNGNGTVSSTVTLDFETSVGTIGDIASLAGRISGIRTGAGTSGALAFSTTDAGVLYERMRITSAGNVGIGASTAPVYNLEVSSTGGSQRIRVGTLQNNDNTPRFEAITSNGVSVANSAWLRVNDAGGFTLGQSDYTKAGGDSGNFSCLSSEVEYPRISVSSGGKVLVGTASNANTGLGTYTKQSIVGDGSINAAASHGSMFVAAGTSTADTGISVNQSTSGMTMMLLASINTSTGTSTNSAVYIVRFYFDGNNTPTATYIGGSSDFVTFGKSGSNTLTLTGSSAGNKSYAWFVNKFGDI